MQHISNQELTLKIKSLFAEERKLTTSILEHIAEVDRRKLYLTLAYPSLFDYLTKEIGYSAGSAQRRIDAARLLSSVPELSDKIEQGLVSLSQVSLLQRAFREKKRLARNQGMKNLASEKSVQGEDHRTEGGALNSAFLSLNSEPLSKKSLIEKLENKSRKETEIILARELDLELKQTERSHYQRDESVRVEMTFSKEEMEVIDLAKALLSHAVRGSQLKDVFVHLCQRYVKQRTAPSRTAATQALPFTATVAVNKHLPATATVAVTHRKPLRRPPVPLPVRKSIFLRDKFCQYRDPLTNKVCGSHYYLEIDHVHPVWAGGKDSRDNLRLLCRAHNQHRYRVGC